MAAMLNIGGLEIPRPLQRHPLVSLATFTIFLSAFLLFILVGLSLTITPSVYIIEVTTLNSMNPVSNVATSLYFGVWGVCAASTLESVVNQSLCYGPQLGYTVPTDLLSAVGLSEELGNVAETSLLILLALHLVGAGLSTIVFVLSLFLHSHVIAITTLVIAILAAVVGTVVFGVDVALVIVARNNIDRLFSSANFSVRFGNGVWLMLIATILTWVAVVLLSARACYCCGVRRPRTSKSGISEKPLLA